MATPQIRQSLHMSPSKSSLSHVVIQQRQIVPPTAQQKPSSTNSNRTSSVVVPPISKSMDHCSEIEAKHSDSETKVAPSNLVSTQMPQASKQIVFETKLQQKPEAIEDKPPNIVEQKPTQVEEYKSKGTPANLPKPNESRSEDATISKMSVIKNILSKTEEKDEEQGRNSSILKEDSEYWSAKEVNIESVIKTVDAMCTTDDEGNADLKIDVKPEPHKSEIVDDVVEKDAAKADATKTDAKVQPKREKGTRNKKAHSAELETQDSPPSVAAAPPNKHSGNDFSNI